VPLEMQPMEFPGIEAAKIQGIEPMRIRGPIQARRIRLK
jgi:hypothetical protein